MNIDWAYWAAELRTRGVVIDRPRGAPHPRFSATIYPVDYGYVPGTVGGDGAPVDVFVGSEPEGELVGAVVTHDELKEDDEVKLLWGTTETEIAVVLEFLNRGFMSGRLVLRRTDPME